MARDNNDNRKSDDEPKRRGNHNQGGNRDDSRGHASKQSKAVLTLNPTPEPTMTTSVKIFDKMDNKVLKEKAPKL